MSEDRTNLKPDKKTATCRGRPRAFDREAALDKATRLFWLKGYAATSISDLTDAIGIGSPSLYAAFGSKEALYNEALQYYQQRFEGLAWNNFLAAATARDAVYSWLMDSAALLSGSVVDIPCGCMVTLSAVGNEGFSQLGEQVQLARAAPFERIKNRIFEAMAEGEIPASVDGHALSRFIQTNQNGMSILARDGVNRAELEAVADMTMLGWDAYINNAKHKA